MGNIPLWDYARFTRDSSHHRAFWNALDDALTPGQKARIASGGDLRGIWEAQPAEAAPAAPTGTDWLTPCRRIVREFEGCRLQAYPDPGTGGDPWTIGWGHTGPDVRQGVKWTQQQADAALDTELSRVRSAVVALLPMLPRWSGAQQAAIISLAYNIGTGALDASTLRRRLLAGEDPGTVVQEELPRWNKGGNGVMPGLTRRRAAEVVLFTGGADAPVWPAGMVGPRKRPPLKPGDHHLIADDRSQTLTAFTHDGRQLWKIACLCRGQGGEAEWNTTGSDTPPGLYRIGRVYRDYEQDPSERFTPDRRAYGWYSLDLEGQEGQEGPGSSNGRDGIMIHGGGSACGWPGAWAPRQDLHPTLGCIRCHNQDLRERILPLLSLGTVWVSVLQERA